MVWHFALRHPTVKRIPFLTEVHDDTVQSFKGKSINYYQTEHKFLTFYLQNEMQETNFINTVKGMHFLPILAA